MYKLALLSTFFFLGLTFARPGVETALRKIVIDDDTSTYFEDQFNKSIECIRKHLQNGDPDRGIPVMDPLVMPKVVDIDIDEDYLTIKLDLKKLIVTGMMGFETVSLSLNSSTLQMKTHYHFDNVSSSSLYSGNLNILSLYAFYGAGNLEIQLLDVDVYVTKQYQMTPPLIGDYSVVVSVGAVNLTMTGLMNDDNLSKVFSQLASKALTVLTNLFQKQITDMISPLIREQVNSVIGHLEFLDYLAYITKLEC